MERRVQVLELHELIVEEKTKLKKKSSVLEFLVNRYNLTDQERSSISTLLEKDFFSKYFSKYDQCRRNKTFFESKHKDWLQSYFNLDGEGNGNFIIFKFCLMFSKLI